MLVEEPPGLDPFDWEFNWVSSLNSFLSHPRRTSDNSPAVPDDLADVTLYDYEANVGWSNNESLGNTPVYVRAMFDGGILYGLSVFDYSIAPGDDPHDLDRFRVAFGPIGDSTNGWELPQTYEHNGTNYAAKTSSFPSPAKVYLNQGIYTQQGTGGPGWMNSLILVSYPPSYDDPEADFNDQGQLDFGVGLSGSLGSPIGSTSELDQNDDSSGNGRDIDLTHKFGGVIVSQLSQAAMIRIPHTAILPDGPLTTFCRVVVSDINKANGPNNWCQLFQPDINDQEGAISRRSYRLVDWTKSQPSNCDGDGEEWPFVPPRGFFKYTDPDTGLVSVQRGRFAIVPTIDTAIPTNLNVSKKSSYRPTTLKTIIEPAPDDR